MILQKSSIQQKQYAIPILNQLIYLSEHYSDKDFQLTVTKCAALLLTSDPIANIQPIADSITHRNFSVLSKVSCLEWIVLAAKYLAGVVVRDKGSVEAEEMAKTLNRLLPESQRDNNLKPSVNNGKTIIKRPAKLRQLYSTKLVYRNMLNEVIENFSSPIFQLMFPHLVPQDSESSSSNNTLDKQAKKNFTSQLEDYFKSSILQDSPTSSPNKSTMKSTSVDTTKRFDSGVDHIILVASFATLRELVKLTSSEA